MSGLGADATVQDIVNHLGATYCAGIGAEFDYLVRCEQRLCFFFRDVFLFLLFNVVSLSRPSIFPTNARIIQEDGEARWFAAQLEETGSASNLIGQEDGVRWAQLLQKCRTFDDFMQVRYASVKRYGAEVCGEGRREGRKEGRKEMR